MIRHIIGEQQNRYFQAALITPDGFETAITEPGSHGTLKFMQLFRETFLLFALNLLDALLTIAWVRSGVATEGNLLMARLLDFGDFPFLGVKILMGTVTAIVLLRWGNRRLARYGVSVALAVYISLMGVHVFTGLAAFGYISTNVRHNLLEAWSAQIFGLVV
ncbi:MAG: DUF5658 family protein [Acidobacteria bacterium]|nr:DUF5658 family protein [Acidobacteriota bacterium]